MKLLYFSWLREKVGVSSEEIEVNSDTINDLIKELVQLDEKYALAFLDLKSVRVAVDQKLVQDFNISIKNAKEVAFFPPMTGG